MITKWTAAPSKQPGSERFKATNRRAEATIERKPDGSAEATCENGLFGLGTHSGATFFAPAPSNQEILERFGDKPRFSGWQQSEEKTPGTNYFEAKADSYFHSDVQAAITRVGDEADIKVKVGHFGTEIEGHYFAPAPSDKEILKRISQR